ASTHGDGSPLATSQGITNLSSGTRGNEIGDAPDPDGLFGFSSDDSLQVPASQRPFQLALPRDHLFGDWFGVRPKVEDFGLTPTLTFVSDVAGNVTGGKSQGVTHADNLGLDVLFDLNKLAGVQGGSFLVSMSQRSGNSLSSEYVGNVFTIQ